MRVTETKRRAAVILFLNGFSFKEVARVLRLTVEDATEIMREHSNGRRWRRR